MMIMTDEQKYSAVLKELGEVLQSKNTTISCQKWQIEQLEEKLKAAEAERDEAVAELECVNIQLQEDEELIVRLREAYTALKGGAA